MSKKMSKNIKISIATILVTIAGLFGYQQTEQIFGSPFDDRNEVTIAGVSGNAVSMPRTESQANATTTDPAQADGGTVIQQLINSGGIRKAVLNVQAVGGTATSSLFIHQMGSHDGVTFFDIASSTAVTSNLTGTTTLTVLPKTVTWDPGLATSTYSVPFLIDGYRYTRFVLSGEDVAGDPNDGVQAWITAVLVRDKEN